MPTRTIRSNSPAALPQVIPGARLVVLDGAAHGLYRSEAQRYATEIINFAAALPTTARC
jgi:pimeloyl-ACP methyl ester carboxylesterase